MDDKKIEVQCPINMRECIKKECRFCTLEDATDIVNRCAFACWLDYIGGGRAAFDARLNELISDCGGYE